MPPISQPQGSRGGLITALVIFAILFLTAAIFAIYFNVNLRAQEVNYAKLDTKYKAVISDSAMVAESDVATAVTALRTDPALGDTNLKWVDVLLQRGDRLAKVIDGANGIPALTAETDASNRIAAANERLRQAKLTGITVDQDNLLGSVDNLVKALINKDKDLAATTADMKTKIDDSAKTLGSSMVSIDESKKAVDAAVDDAKKARDEAAADRTKKQGEIDELTTASHTAIDAANVALQAKVVEMGALNTRLATQDKEVDVLKKKVAQYRLDTVETTVRRPDGSITSLGANNTVYINLGKGDQVIEGMTFEVYDKVEGVPAMGADGLRTEELPIGKGSVEIVHVGAATSECRIVKTTPGSAIAEGDIIANLVYDPNVKFNFIVFGKFALDPNKAANTADTDVIKRLVTQWGGKVADTVNADTDFVVLGKEPELPNFSKEELDLPENAKKLADAQAEQDAYQKVKADARELHIPVMNQNRFLYFVGFFDQAKR